MRFVLTSFPDAAGARSAGRQLVEENLAACASVVDSVHSIYRWEGRIEESDEALLLLKTTLPDALMRRLEEIHPYEVPEIAAFEPAQVAGPYRAWVESCCATSRGSASA